MTHHLETTLRRALKNADSASLETIPSASSRYLDLAENIVRPAIAWQDENGRIIDPHVHRETTTTTARFVGALGLLISQGRCRDMVDVCAKSLTPTLEDLFHVKTAWGEFIVKEACAAYAALKDHVATDLVSRWKRMLSDYDPEQAYARTYANNSDALNNFCTFGIAGEAFKKKLGLADNEAFMDRYVEQQLAMIDANGMYHDPNSPMAYDVVSRMNLTLALWAGYDGIFAERLSEALKLGGLSQLLYQSPTGECPFGGRSNQQNFNEATFALVCEFEATRWKRLGDNLMAAAFKRAAALAIHSIEPYISRNPILFTKNWFPPETQHGRQQSYGFYGAYSLLIASQLGFAHLLADDSISDGACPADSGGYAFVTDSGFHKLFAACGGTHVEIDLNADFHYDATGLGRVHFASAPSELALSGSITATPGYLTSVPNSPENVAIGPGWENVWLAGLNGEELRSTTEILQEDADAVAFKLTHQHETGVVTESYDVSRTGVVISVERQGGEGLKFRVPLLKTNGKDDTEIKTLKNGFTVSFKNFTYKVECLTPNVTICLEDFEAPNRNGVHAVGRLSVDGGDMRVRLSVSKTN